MQANEWIKENGWGEAKNLIAANGWRNTPFLIKIKRLVASYEFVVNDFESMEIAKYQYMVSGCHSEPYWIQVKQAIADVESCQ